MKFVAWFCMIVGIMMIAQWSFFVATGNVPELKTEPVRIAFHLAAEGATALALILSGWGLSRGRSWGGRLALFALGMLAYTSIVSPGYFAQQGGWPLVGMFAFLIVMTVFSLFTTYKYCV